MTTLYQESLQCALCGTEDQYSLVSSTSSFGSADLDTRPPALQRFNIGLWVQRCAECGYCASDISQAMPQAAEMLQHPMYTSQLTDTTYPELANSFLCQAFLAVEAEDYAQASWALIHAAWACDDAELDAQAQSCRSRAAEMIRIALNNEQEFADQAGAETAIRVDLLRRSGRFEDALKVIQAQQASISEEVILKVLAFQAALIERGDGACYLISDALDEHQ